MIFKYICFIISNCTFLLKISIYFQTQLCASHEFNVVFFQGDRNKKPYIDTYNIPEHFYDLTALGDQLFVLFPRLLHLIIPLLNHMEIPDDLQKQREMLPFYDNRQLCSLVLDFMMDFLFLPYRYAFLCE